MLLPKQGGRKYVCLARSWLKTERQKKQVKRKIKPKRPFYVQSLCHLGLHQSLKCKKKILDVQIDVLKILFCLFAMVTNYKSADF